MFDNIGGKIKIVAQTLCWIGIVASVIIGIVFISQGEETILLGLLIALIGALSSWIGSFITYGFGQLIENSDILVESVEQIDKQSGLIHKTVFSCTREISSRLPRDNKSNAPEQSTTPANSTLEEMRTYKTWLDDGIITQEEFIAKANQLFDL